MAIICHTGNDDPNSGHYICLVNDKQSGKWLYLNEQPTEEEKATFEFILQYASAEERERERG